MKRKRLKVTEKTQKLENNIKGKNIIGNKKNEILNDVLIEQLMKKKKDRKR